MKASELIEALEIIKKRTGDCEVYIPYMDDEYRFVEVRIAFDDVNREHACSSRLVDGIFLNGWCDNKL